MDEKPAKPNLNAPLSSMGIDKPPPSKAPKEEQREIVRPSSQQPQSQQRSHRSPTADFSRGYRKL
jgi:hypothetical protein